MSYARFGCDGSDVYIYQDIDFGLRCQLCPLGGSFDTRSRAAMLAHVAAHRAAGHRVPESVDEALRDEIAAVGDDSPGGDAPRHRPPRGCAAAVRRTEGAVKPPAPPRVDNHYKYWGDPPPERSARCAWWVARIEGGWRPNRRITSEGYDASSSYYGVYIWEYLHVIAPLLDRLRTTSATRGEKP